MQDLRLIAAHFFEMEQWLDAAPFGNGNINDTWRVRFSRNGQTENWILQRLNTRVFNDPQTLMRNTSAVCRHLVASDDYPYAVIPPKPARNGDLLVQDSDGLYWRAFLFYDNTYAPENDTSPELAYKAACAYGAFARALRHFPAQELTEVIPGFHDTLRRWAVFEKILLDDRVGRAAHVGPEIEQLHRLKPVFEQIDSLKKSGRLPLRVTHNDSKAGNILFDRTTHQAIAVIDFDTVMPGTLLADFGDMVRSFGPDRPEGSGSEAHLRRDVLIALRNGFLSQTDGFLTDDERNNLGLAAQWIIGEQALRFLTDYLDGDQYFKIAHPEHNLERTRNQLSLLRDSDATFADIFSSSRK